MPLPTGKQRATPGRIRSPRAIIDGRYDSSVLELP